MKYKNYILFYFNIFVSIISKIYLTRQNLKGSEVNYFINSKNFHFAHSTTLQLNYNPASFINFKFF